MTTTANPITDQAVPANQAPSEWVKDRLEDAKQLAQTLPWDQIKDGTWFQRLLTTSLGTYAREVNADFFRRKYPGVATDVIVERQIELAQKYAAISGGMTAGAYSAAVAGFLGTAGSRCGAFFRGRCVRDHANSVAPRLRHGRFVRRDD